MKTCKKCGILKELKFFHKNRTYKDGHENKCKLCRDYYKINKEKLLSYQKSYDSTHLENRKDYRKAYRSKNKIQSTERSRIRYNNDIEYKIKSTIRVRIYNALKENKSNKSIEYLGCTIQEYKQYLESKFTSEMNWDNYGSYWEIDHIYPLSKGGSFHYTNTQPLTINENRTKSDKI